MQTTLAPSTYEIAVRAPFMPPVRDMVKTWCEDVLDSLSCADAVYSTKIDEVENEHRDGFIPFTEGGFDGIGYANMGHAIGSGRIPIAIEPYVASSQKDAEEEWDRQNPEHTVAWLYEEAPEDAGQHYLFARSIERETWREKWYDFESEWHNDGGTYFYKVRALFYDTDNSNNQSGQPEVFFMVGINTDFEYGRDYVSWLTAYGSSPHCTKWVWEKNIPAAEITPELMEQFAKEASEALARLA